MPFTSTVSREDRALIIELLRERNKLVAQLDRLTYEKIGSKFDVSGEIIRRINRQVDWPELEHREGGIQRWNHWSRKQKEELEAAREEESGTKKRSDGLQLQMPFTLV